ncbi:MAG: hypothetical protein EOO11_01420, partial [Chitinophagaceae bacterium]
MKTPKPLTGYLYFSRKDRFAAVGFVLLFGGLYVLPRLFPGPTRVAAVPDSILYKKHDPAPR